MSERLRETIARIRPPDENVADEVARLLDAKTKPPGSLGRLEELACRLAAIRRRVPDHELAAAIVVAAADHGVAIEGVSAYPAEVTGQMLANFAGGGAAICVLSRLAGARLVVVDAGVVEAPIVDGIRSAVVDGVRGTRNMAEGPAMSRSTATAMIEQGIDLADELADDGVELLALGDMGIANTSAASALAAALLPADPSRVCGRGTGLDESGLERKIDVVRRSLAVNGLDGKRSSAPLTVLASVGGLEIAFLAGVALGGAARGLPVMLDGFITGAAAFLAAELTPDVAASMIAATRSPEPGHGLVLERLRLEPLLDLGLRLGEGSGAALALPLVRAAVAILTEMATFETAGVSREVAGDA